MTTPSDRDLTFVGYVETVYGPVPVEPELKALIDKALALASRTAPRTELIQRNTEIAHLLLVDGLPGSEVAERFGMHQSQVSEIVKRWRRRVEPVIRRWLDLPARNPMSREAKPARQTRRTRRRQYRQ